MEKLRPNGRAEIRQVAFEGKRQEMPEGKTTTADGNRRQKKMVEEEGRQMAENSIPRGKAQKAAPERRKGTFYLLLAAWWPTVKGQKWFARKGVERRLQAFEESQNCAANVHSFPQGNTRNNPQGNARERMVCDS